MEALIGAIYLDGGMSAAAGVLRRLGLTEDA
jgi:ribonuclease-3